MFTCNAMETVAHQLTCQYIQACTPPFFRSPKICSSHTLGSMLSATALFCRRCLVTYPGPLQTNSQPTVTLAACCWGTGVNQYHSINYQSSSTQWPTWQNLFNAWRMGRTLPEWTRQGLSVCLTHCRCHQHTLSSTAACQHDWQAGPKESKSQFPVFLQHSSKCRCVSTCKHLYICIGLHYLLSSNRYGCIFIHLYIMQSHNWQYMEGCTGQTQCWPQSKPAVREN